VFDVLIQTYNEELNLPTTLKSLKGLANRVFVVDSGSTDATTRLAEQYGATVVFHRWEGYARQKNWALDNLPIESPWVLILDADEAVSPELAEELRELTSRDPDTVEEAGFHVNRVFIFFGREIRHCGYFPSWNLRLFKTGRARYEDRSVHEHMIVDGTSGYLRHLLLHEDRRGLEHFFAKHNRYSTLEAQEIFDKPEPWPGVGRFLTDRVTRRRFGKSRILPYLPMPWIWRLIYMYFIRLGFMDGRAGWLLCNFISSYEFFVQLKFRELVRMNGRQPVVVRGLAQAEGDAEAVRAARATAEVTEKALNSSGASSASSAEGSRGPAVALASSIPSGSIAGSGTSAATSDVPVSGSTARADAETVVETSAAKVAARDSGTAVSKGESPGGVVGGDAGVSTPHHRALEDRTLHTAVKDRDQIRFTSPWTLRQNMIRVMWMIVSALFFRTSFHNWYGWRRMLLRMFGAKIGHDVRIRPTVKIEIPWNLDIDDGSIVGDHAILYSLGKITLGKRVIISQYAHLCAGTHDYRYKAFPLVRPPITIGDEAWIAADAFVGPGVTMGRRAVLGARASAFRDIGAEMIAAGNPAREIKRRESLDPPDTEPADLSHAAKA
jgi:putative colanic acid biosynthesis acetyltransferase WcaF